MQVVDEQQEHAAGRVVGRTVARQDDAFLHRRRRRRLHVVDAPAVGQHERRDLLLDAVLVDLELVRLEVGDELIALLIADDDVGRDEIDADAEGGLGRRLRLTGGRCGLLAPARARRQAVKDAPPGAGRSRPAASERSSGAHTIDYTHANRRQLPIMRDIVLKQELAAKLTQQGHDVLDLGTHSAAPVDYPDSAEAVAVALRDEQADRGIIVCGSGAGVSIAANKFPGIRAAVCHDTYTAHQAVEHDDMNVLCLGARVVGAALALEVATAFLAAVFSGEDRHQRRLNKVHDIERRFSRS